MVHKYLVSKADSHHSDEEGEERLQLAQSVLVQQQEGERVCDRDQHASPQGNSG